MNIGRAKTILIFAFLGLNLLLCYHLFGDSLRQSSRLKVTGKEWRHIEEQLAESGYILEAKLDGGTRKSSFLTVSPSAMLEQRARELYAAAAVPPESAGAPPLHEGGEALLRVFPGGLVRVTLTPGVSFAGGAAAAGEPAETAALLERYLLDRELAPAGICYDRLERTGEKTNFYYLQSYEGMLLFSGYLKAVVENNVLVEIEGYLLQPESSLQEREMEVITAARALSRLGELLGPGSPSRRIVKVDLGFYSREYDAERWEIPPVWRFLFDDGESCFINAFTGNLEPESSN
ncbi:MAG: hypothetical protein GYA86_01395 [Firmicutes bacterium]|nr:hypothetical protein [Bacillota bacterium]